MSNEGYSELASLLARARGLSGLGLTTFLQEVAATHGESVAAEVTRGLAEPRPVGRQIGPYRIHEEIGRGGMGIVYEAEQQGPVRRLVALKVVRSSIATGDVLARFQLERRALAAMSHRCIAKVFDAGATEDGEPYFVMELVEGLPLTEYCDKHRLKLVERLELFQQVCEGVHHAHQKGIIHRDLKPGNVLVVREGERAVPKILDFGLAKVTNREFLDETLHTAHDRVLGTLEYMAPEQAAGDGEPVDARADIYSLGVMLYELLCGELPFPTAYLRRAGVQEALRLIREESPIRPSTRLTSRHDGDVLAAQRQTSVAALRRALAGDLDWVVLKAMTKEPERRYDAATALAADIGRYLRCEPVLAGPPSFGYRLQKFLRRNSLQCAAGGIVLAATLGGGTTAAVSLAAERRAHDEFDQLASVVEHDRVVAAAAALHPPWPEQIPAMERWIEDDCGRLLAMRSGLVQTIEQLRAQSTPPTPEQRQRERESHPRYAEWQELGRHIESLQRAQLLRTGGGFAPAALTEVEQLPGWRELNEQAWLRVAPLHSHARIIHGQEARGLAFAEAGAVRASGDPYEHYALSTLAWALLANGQDERAMAVSARAVEVAQQRQAGPAEQEERHEHHLREQAAADPAAQLAAAGAELALAAAAIDERRSYRFAAADAAKGFLYEHLTELVDKLLPLERDEKPRVEARLEWARRIGALSRDHPNAWFSWSEARAALARADGVSASGLYRGQQLPLDDRDVVGLVPIGMNPFGLWEFYDLRSAWDGEADPARLPIPRYVDGKLEVTEASGIVLVLIPGGTFVMGAQQRDVDGPNFDPSADADEVVHEVALEPFFLGKYEMTQAQWARLWGSDEELAHPSYYGCTNPQFVGTITPTNPVETVTWSMCETLLAHHGMVLPTEAQWEYACRAGRATPWWPGGERGDLAGNANVFDATAAAQEFKWGDAEVFADGFPFHAPVGSFGPNPFGLHDVHGNVWEWCRDTDGPYGTERPGDGLRAATGRYRVFRGGSYMHAAAYARSANRPCDLPASSRPYCGVRCARVVRRPD